MNNYKSLEHFIKIGNWISKCSETISGTCLFKLKNLPTNFNMLFDEINTPLKNAICLSIFLNESKVDCIVFVDGSCMVNLYLSSTECFENVIKCFFNNLFSEIRFIIDSSFVIDDVDTIFFSHIDIDLNETYKAMKTSDISKTLFDNENHIKFYGNDGKLIDYPLHFTLNSVETIRMTYDEQLDHYKFSMPLMLI